MKRTLYAAICFLLAQDLAQLHAATFFGPTPYLSRADIPPGLYVSGAPTVLEDFEDGNLDPSIIASTGRVIPPEFLGLIDSVDADDGVIDGSGLNGHSWFTESGQNGILFTFPRGTIAAGLVWTDGYDPTVFSAFGPGHVPLGQIGPFNGIADNDFYGKTAEDRFFGVRDPGGIESIFIATIGGGIEVDHVQYEIGSAPDYVINWQGIGPAATSGGGDFMLESSLGWLGAGHINGGDFAMDGKFAYDIDLALLRITQAQTVGNDLVLSFPSTIGKAYTIQTSIALPATDWSDISTEAIIGTGAPIQAVIPNALAEPQRFYRLKRLP